MVRTLISWNVNGLRAVERKGFLTWLERERYDLVSLQETKISAETKLSESLREPPGYRAYWDYATEKKGYSGVACYAREDFLPERATSDFPEPVLTGEGRLLELDYSDFVFFNVYFPNGKASPARLRYKMDFYAAFLARLKKLRRAGRAVIFCGDVNTAHAEIDLARPKENSTVSGFLPRERAWLDEVVAAGFVDTFRHFVKAGGHYSWWDQFTHARERNVGWRIDYFFASEDLLPKIRDAFILGDVLGSDHAPVGIKLAL